MDAYRFDRFVRACSANGTRRVVLRALAALPLGGTVEFLVPPLRSEAEPEDDLGDEKLSHKQRCRRRKGKGRGHHGRRKHCRAHHGGHKKRKHKQKNKNKKCKPESPAITCEGKCGTVQNTCKQNVDCGSCDCKPPCPICQTCQSEPNTPGVCVPANVGQPCGNPGEVCQANGSCACDVCAAGCPFGSLQEAIDDPTTQDGDIITICPGHYLGTTSVSKSVTLQGTGAGDNQAVDTILDGNLDGRVLTITESQAVTLRGLRITGGLTDQPGGGIANFGALTMEDCTVIDNETTSGFTGGGGGIYQAATATSLTATNCIIEQNRAVVDVGHGGGIFSSNNASVTLTNCIIRDNAASDVTPQGGAGTGGGLCFRLAPASVTHTLSECQIGPNNRAAFGGGIVMDRRTRVTLDGTTVFENQASRDGGGIDNSGTLNLTNGSAIEGNTAAETGGGISNFGLPLDRGAVVLSADSSITGNHAGSLGGGVYNDGTIDCDGIISDNTAGDPADPSNCINAGGSGCETCPPPP